MNIKPLSIIFFGLLFTACTTLNNRTISSLEEYSSENLCQSIKSQYRELGAPKKMLIIQTSNWSAFQANAQLVKKNQLGQWEEVGEPIPFVVGRNGMALGYNLAQFKDLLTAPVKKEGDSKTPAGLHLIGKKFGFASAYHNDTNYKQITAKTYCVDDTQSKHYNAVVNLDENKSIAPNWKSAEKMLSIDLYELGAEIDYKSNAEKAAGSCIFMHLWRQSTKGTAGCVATSKTNLDSVLNFAKDKTPLLIATFPKDVYSKVKSCF